MMIRKATSADIPAISNLLEQVLTIHHNGRPDIFKSGAKKYTEQELSVLLCDPKRPIFVAEEQEQVVGYCFCILEQHINHNVLTDIKTLYIDDLCVDENKRGMHVGQKLYAFVKEFAAQQGCYNVTLNVWSCNPDAIRFYERLGLVPQKTYMEEIL